MDTLERVNATRASIMIREHVSDILEDVRLELNDSATRQTVRVITEGFLDGMRARQAINEYKVICDETNNTPEDIDNGILRTTVFFQPDRRAEFIILNISVGREGVIFGDTDKEMFASDADAWRYRLGI